MRELRNFWSYLIQREQKPMAEASLRVFLNTLGYSGTGILEQFRINGQVRRWSDGENNSYIDGYSILAFGGAQSFDRGIATGTEKRDAHKWWWKEELPLRKEYDQARRNLKRRNNTVDFIISHEAPGVALHRLWLPQNEVSNKLWEIYDHTAFDMWYCGHHHIDAQYGRVRLLYNDIERIDNLTNYRISLP